jgi:hypothetical protein
MLLLLAAAVVVGTPKSQTSPLQHRGQQQHHTT